MASLFGLLVVSEYSKTGLAGSTADNMEPLSIDMQLVACSGKHSTMGTNNETTWTALMQNNPFDGCFYHIARSE